MSRQNRVTPFGELIATPARGTLMGNRGCLHDDQQQVLKASARDQWITCRLEWNGNRRNLMAPGKYTELFFLDEVTALAAGHRPCGECRAGSLHGFVAAWAIGVNGNPERRVLVGEIDALLKTERRTMGGHRSTYRALVGDLPDGAMTVRSGLPLLKWQDRLYRWSAGGYTGSEALDLEQYVDVLTPPSIVKVLQAGYLPEIHPSAR